MIHVTPYNPLNPVNALSRPAIPHLPKDGDDLKESLLAKVPIFSLAVGHRRDISWEEKREADFQRSLMTWTSVALSWPGEWEAGQDLRESETVVQVCEQLS